MRKKSKILIFLFILGTLLGWSAFIYYYGPEKIVSTIGVRQGYALVFFSALIGGSSIFTSAFFYTTAATLGAGGLHPLLIGLCGGLGIGSGDLIFYFLGKNGRSALSQPWEQKIIRWEKWLQKKPVWVLPLFLFCYSSLAPLPNDIVTASLAAIRVPLRSIIIPLVLGNIMFISLISYGVSFF